LEPKEEEKEIKFTPDFEVREQIFLRVFEELANNGNELVASALPGEKEYSPLNQLNYVKWNANATPRILKSAAEVMTAEKNGELSVVKTNIVINSPAVMLSNK
jgi:hypothetical protein